MANRLDDYKRDGVSRPTTAPTNAGGPPTDFFASLLPQQNVQARNAVRKVPLDLIDPWRDAEGNTQPFRPYPTEKLQELAENIRQNGLITPVRLRVSPFEMSRYQTLAGHNRIAAAKLIGMAEIDAIVENVDDDTARMIMVDSNLQQREKLLPSEKAFAYKIRMEAIKHQGKRSDLTSTQVVSKLTSNEILENETGESRETIRRFICLTRLSPSLLDMVDADAIPFVAGVALSFLSPAAQETLLEVTRRNNITSVNRSQAEELKERRDKLDMDGAASLILRVFGLGAAKPPKPQSWKFKTDYPANIVKKYGKDAELQRRIAETIKNYIEEKER